MRQILLTLVVFPSLLCLPGHAQTSSNKVRMNASAQIRVALSLAKDDSPPSSGGLRVKIIVTNNSNDFLVRRLAGSRNALDLALRDAEGATPSETSLGAERHIMSQTAPAEKKYTRTHIYPFIVPPGGSAAVIYDVGKEFMLTAGKTYVITALLQDAVLVESSPELLKTTEGARYIALSNYEGLPHHMIDTISSNALRVGISH